MDRYLLQYFLAVVEAGNFSKAAARVNVAQPTLSVGIAKLESQLGAKLFHRTNRRVYLTEAGSRFLARARRIEHEYNLAAEELSTLGGGRLIRLGVLSTIPVLLLERLVARHRQVEGADRLEILEGSEREVSNLLDRGRVDVALTILRPGSERAAQDPLYPERYLLALPHWHRLAQAEALKAEDLAGEAMLLRQQCEALAETSRHFTERNIRPLFSFRTANDERALALVRAGLGVTVMPESYVDAGVRRIRLVDFDVTRVIGLVYADHASELRTQPPALIRLAREVLTGGGGDGRLRRF